MTIAHMAPLLGVQERQMYRMVEGKSPFTLGGAYTMCGLLDRPFGEIFEERSYVNGRRRLVGWFPRRVTAVIEVPA